MRNLIKIGILLSLLSVAFWIWYDYTYSMDTVIPFEVNSRALPNKVLIASQGSAFKDSLVQHIIKHYHNEPIYFKIIDAYTLFTVKIDKWDALIIINSWEYASPPKNVKKFIAKHPDQLNKLIILSTIGSYNFSLKDVDMISGESIIEHTPLYAKKITNRLDSLLNVHNNPSTHD
ncbi:hypothetical protein [Aquimarina intermedia]|uniref:Flavodoxin domain-containing protein n=1 Tax=Aquimarina intermedia TaxID=350814 RepID=A0A5S5C6M0_9FLAO|nr:hypothetical protein [Aquimarina intermedia]TYP74248.1 hypothetical protein BD809_10466 [Aquimarina intermedia]